MAGDHGGPRRYFPVVSSSYPPRFAPCGHSALSLPWTNTSRRPSAFLRCQSRTTKRPSPENGSATTVGSPDQGSGCSVERGVRLFQVIDMAVGSGGNVLTKTLTATTTQSDSSLEGQPANSDPLPQKGSFTVLCNFLSAAVHHAVATSKSPKKRCARTTAHVLAMHVASGRAAAAYRHPHHSKSRTPSDGILPSVRPRPLSPCANSALQSSSAMLSRVKWIYLLQS
jgi:hypothetical protein